MTTRRNFLKSSAAAGITAFAAPAVALNVRGANERIRVGLVGLGGRMQSHIGSLTVLSQSENVEIAAICDCDQSKLDSAVKTYPDLEGLKLKTYRDQRDFSTIETSMPSASRPRTTGMPCRRFGPARRVRTSTWRNRRPGASGKAARWSRPRTSTAGWCRSVPRTARIRSSVRACSSSRMD